MPGSVSAKAFFPDVAKIYVDRVSRPPECATPIKAVFEKTELLGPRPPQAALERLSQNMSCKNHNASAEGAK
jgi:hypothetical protein